MIAWKNTTEALGYAASRLDDALDALGRHAKGPDRALQLAQEAINEATAALVMVQHTRAGDALVTIDQLHAELADTTAAQPTVATRRRCCQTWTSEAHAAGCVSLATRPVPQRVLEGLK